MTPEEMIQRAEKLLDNSFANIQIALKERNVNAGQAVANMANASANLAEVYIKLAEHLQKGTK